MKIEPPVNDNYAAVVCRIPAIVKLENADRLQGIPLYGLQAIVDLKPQVGDLGVFFPAETQLSFEYAFHNDMHSHASKESGGVIFQLNKTPDSRGYLGDNRRVRAIKLRGNRSDALWMPLSSLEWTGADLSQLKEGVVFDHLNGHEICRKYVVARKTSGGQNQPKTKKESRVDPRLFPEHFNTAHFLREVDHLDPSAPCIVTQKVHGTSIRIGHIPVKRSLSLRERIAKRFGVKVRETEYAYVFGSRKVVKDANNPDAAHFYDEDVWSNEGKKLEGLIPENWLVFAEIIGWTDGGSPIQHNYAYCQPHGTRRLLVYRIAVVNNQGTLVDLSWDAVVAFCKSVGLETVPALFKTTIRNLTDPYAHGQLINEYLDVKLQDMFSWALPLDPTSPCDEGVCIRIEDGLIPTILKAKSPLFLAHETRLLDEEVVDIESDDAA